MFLCPYHSLNNILLCQHVTSVLFFSFMNFIRLSRELFYSSSKSIIVVYIHCREPITIQSRIIVYTNFLKNSQEGIFFINIGKLINRTKLGVHRTYTHFEKVSGGRLFRDRCKALVTGRSVIELGRATERHGAAAA